MPGLLSEAVLHEHASASVEKSKLDTGHAAQASSDFSYKWTEVQWAQHPAIASLPHDSQLAGDTTESDSE